ncbi:MAG: CsiV family protein [Coxiellaceae bacterium]|nr:CsiV family protein [Coxiellaceae bacterium]
MTMLKRFVFSTMLALFSATVFAAPRTYNVQVIVFSHLTAQTLAGEQWPVISPPTVNAPTPSHSATALQAEANTLRKNPEYQVLFSGSWIQTWNNDSGTITLPLSNGNNLQGTMTVTLGHYFDIHTNLFFTQPINLLQRIDTSGYFSQLSQSDFTFALSQDRRMKSGELNYLGNPVMGVLIKILKNG